MLHFSRIKGLGRIAKRGGFTLLELLVTISIVTIMLMVIILNQSNYTDTAALTNLADQISSTVSQAQAYGVGVKNFAPGEFNASYGLSFSLLSSGSPTAYMYFADRGTPGNQFFDGTWACPVGDSSECIEKVNITRGNIIESVCMVLTNGPDNCSGVRRIDIVFVRPSTEAKIKFFNASGVETTSPNLKAAKVILRSPKGSRYSVIVYPTGQISVKSGT